MQFVVSFGPLFYTTYGLGDMAFTYNLIARIFNLVFSLPVALAYDRFGRRPLLFIGTFLSMIWLIMVGALGGQENPTEATVRTVVASVILLQTCCYLGLSKGCWIVGPEIGSATMRRKSESRFAPSPTFPFPGQTLSSDRVIVLCLQSQKQWQLLLWLTHYPDSRYRTRHLTCWIQWEIISVTFFSDSQSPPYSGSRFSCQKREVRHLPLPQSSRTDVHRSASR